jgi:hypothetical protein
MNISLGVVNVTLYGSSQNIVKIVSFEWPKTSASEQYLTTKTELMHEI